MGVQLEYINHLWQVLKTFPIMPALCSMLSVTYYAQNYAGIIGWSLTSAYGQCLPGLKVVLNFTYACRHTHVLTHLMHPKIVTTGTVVVSNEIQLCGS